MKKVYIVFQTGLDALSVHKTKEEANTAMSKSDLFPLNCEEWDETEAREAYPYLFLN